MERYLSAARRISRLALGSADTPATSFTVRLRPDLPQYERVEGLPFGTRGGTLIRHTFRWTPITTSRCNWAARNGDLGDAAASSSVSTANV